MQVVYEDNHIIIVNKQAGEIVQGDRTGDRTLADDVKAYIKERYAKPGEVFLGTVHRLDRPAQGLVLFARTSKALSRLNDMLRRGGMIRKTYWAITANRPQDEEGHLEQYLVRNPKNNKTYVAREGAKDAKLAKRLKSELEWVRSSPKARQAKNKARLERYDQMEQEARNSKKLDFSEIQIPPGPRLGSQVLEAKHIHKAFGDRVLIDDLSFTLPRNGIVGVIGPNGVGKSTLFKTIVGLEPLTSGELTVGDTVKISYVDQNRAGLDPKKNLWEAVSDGLDFIEVGGVEVPTRAYVASFGFKGSDQQKLTGVLSGGERNRLNLALTLKQGGNLLLLDEPTNDLDVETLESLENALIEFPGCAVVISHDRWFLDRIATHILAWEGDDENPARWYWFEGNFQAYQENKVARLGEDAARPHRLHRKLTR